MDAAVERDEAALIRHAQQEYVDGQMAAEQTFGDAGGIDEDVAAASCVYC